MPDANAQSPIPDPNPSALTAARYYYQNAGQIVDENGNAASNVLYYQEKANAFYLSPGKIHYYSRRSDTSAAGIDTLHRVDMAFKCDGYPEVACGQIVTQTLSADHLNYYLPHYPAGITNVKGYKSIGYTNAFPNVDVWVSGSAESNVLFIDIKPGGNPADVIFAFQGQDSLVQNVFGGVDAWAGNQQFPLPPGAVYQYGSSGITPVTSWLPTWNLNPAGEVTLSVGGYDPTKHLVIKVSASARPAGVSKPDWGTYYGAGGNADEGARDIDVEQGENQHLYTVQEQRGNAFLSYGGSSTNAGQTDLYISRFDMGSARLYATYFGSSFEDKVSELKVVKSKSSGGLYITGNAHGEKLPQASSIPTGAFYQADGEAYLAEFKRTDGTRVWVTQIYGNNGFRPRSLDINLQTNRLYLSGTNDASSLTGALNPTGSTAGVFPLQPGPSGSNRFYKTSGGGSSAIMEFNIDNNSLVWSTFMPNGMNVYSLHSANSRLLFGGATDNHTYSSVVTTPLTTATDIPLVRPTNSSFVQTSYTNPTTGNHSGVEGIVGYFDDNFQLAWCTYYGGTGSEIVSSVKQGANGDMYICGSTNSETPSLSTTLPGSTQYFPYFHPATSNYNQLTFGGGTQVTGTNAGERTDDFVARFNSTALLKWASYFGGSSNEGNNFYFEKRSKIYNPKITVDNNNELILAGTTQKATATVSTASIPIIAASGVYTQNSNASSNEALNGRDVYYALFGTNNKLKWSTHFGGDGTGGTNNYDIRANEQLMDICVDNSYKRIYTFMNTNSAKTPTGLPPTTTTTPYYDNTLDGTSDAFISYLKYGPVSVGIPSLETETASSIRLWPNPSNGTIRCTAKIENAGNYKIEVIALNGVKVREANLSLSPFNNEFAIELREVPNGTYLLNISDNAQTRTALFTLVR